MIKDKITQELRDRFLQEINKSRDTGKERGFHLCIENDTKLSAGEICIGNECSTRFQDVSISCKGRKVQGDFHTHPYLDEARKKFDIPPKISDDSVRFTLKTFFEEKGRTSTTPSHTDAISAILTKCSKRTEGTTCVGSDLDINQVECWTPKNIEDGDCLRALVEQISPRGKGYKTMPHDWVEPLFEKEMIELKSTTLKSTKPKSTKQKSQKR